MKGLDLYLKVRHAVRIEGLSERAAARRFGIDPRTVNKMMKFSVPPGYVRKKPPRKPKLDPFIPVIDGILGDDRSRAKKQQHTAKRIFERLRDEHGYAGRLTIVKDYVALWRQRAQEMFIPLVHPPGHAQADFGEAIGVISGVERKIHFFAMDLPHSDACIVAAYPAETTEAFCDGHVRLSITHNFSPDHRSERDVGEARYPAPHDGVTGRWIAGAGEIAAEPGDLGQIVRERLPSSLRLIVHE